MTTTTAKKNGRYTPKKEQPAPSVPEPGMKPAEAVPGASRDAVGRTVPMNEVKTIMYLKQLVGDNAVELAAYKAALDDAMDQIRQQQETIDRLMGQQEEQQDATA